MRPSTWFVTDLEFRREVMMYVSILENIAEKYAQLLIEESSAPHVSIQAAFPQ
jgi:hypothetical protein